LGTGVFFSEGKNTRKKRRDKGGTLGKEKTEKDRSRLSAARKGSTVRGEDRFPGLVGKREEEKLC